MRNFIRRIITGKDHSLAGALLKPFLFVLSLCYQALVVVLCWLFRSGILAPYQASRPVISVGNITAGGVGKTPLVMFIAEYLTGQGLRPVVLTRGYMSGCGESDEAVMMAQRLQGVQVIVDPDRIAGIKEALSHARVDAFILDDGFQHWRLRRDLDIVVIDATDPFGNGCLLPAGLLREPLSALKRAGLFVLTKTDFGRHNVADIRRKLERVHPGCMIVETVHAPTALVDAWVESGAIGLSQLKDRVAGLCAIGSPDSFEAMLKAQGAQVEGMFVFDDHHVYTDKDIRRVVDFCRDQKIAKVVTTHKDVVKLRVFQKAFQGISLLVFKVNIKVIYGETELFSKLCRCCHP